MSDLFRLAFIGGGAYLLWKYMKQREAQDVLTARRKEDIKLQAPLPPGATPTGRTKQTRGGKPGEEVVGYKLLDFAEIRLPTGERDWVEIKVRSPFQEMA